MKQIDLDSIEFQEELKKTAEFVKKINKNFAWSQHPNKDVNEGVIMGLARNKLLYGKRFCPCFMVEGETVEEQKLADNRLCPCKPALEEEIPNNGSCHCGLFCTDEYIEKERAKMNQNNLHNLLKKENINSKELEVLLEERALNKVDFLLIDVREQMEHDALAIVGTDALLPTSSFKSDIEKYETYKDKVVIVYCQAGSRSSQIQKLMKSLDFKEVISLENGIRDFEGKKEVKKQEIAKKDKEFMLVESKTLESRELDILYTERDDLLRRLRVITSVVNSLNVTEEDLEKRLESIVYIVESLGNKEFCLVS